LAQDCARQIVDAFAHYNAQFRAITRRAPLRFDGRDWRGSQQDAIERIGLYDRSVNQTIAEFASGSGAGAQSRPVAADPWRVRSADHGTGGPGVHQDLLQLHQPQTVRHGGRPPDIEFVATDLDPLAKLHSAVGTNTYVNHGSLSLLFEDLLGDVRFRSPWRDLDNTSRTSPPRCATTCPPASSGAMSSGSR